MRKISTMEKRSSWIGVSFIIPWIIGFLVFYLYPLVMSLLYSFSNLQVATGEMDWLGWANYERAFRSDVNYIPNLVSSLKVIAFDTPGIMVFSMVIALVLNQKFRGQGLFKVIFFLPVIISSGVLLDILNSDMISSILRGGERSSGGTFSLVALEGQLLQFGVGEEIIRTILNTANDVFDLSWKSCVQILLFISGMQSISSSLYEAADIDGCTAWEKYWKITFPLLLPILMVNIVYTLTDNFLSSSNPMMGMILTLSQNLNFSYAAALSWVYFIIISAIIGVVFLVFRKSVSDSF